MTRTKEQVKAEIEGIELAMKLTASIRAPRPQTIKRWRQLNDQLERNDNDRAG